MYDDHVIDNGVRGREAMNEPEDNAVIRDKAVRLFSYLYELTRLRSKQVASLDQYDMVLWLDEIPRQPGCYCAAWQQGEDKDGGEAWVEIKKPTLVPAPEVPETLAPWTDAQDLSDSSLEMPNHRVRIPLVEPGSDQHAGHATSFRTWEDDPLLEPLWEKYIEEKWWPWQELDRKLQEIQRVYTDLFSIYQKQKRLGEQYEVILGLGCLTWRTPKGQEIKRHLLVAQTSLSFDIVRGVITVGPAGEGAKPTLEQDMLDPSLRPGASEQHAIETKVAEIGDDIWGYDEVRDMLTGWVQSVSEKGQFFDLLASPKQVGNAPVVQLAPAIVLRRRSERNLLRTLQTIVEQLANEEFSVPLGVKRLVTIVDDLSPGGEDRNDFAGRATEVGDVYFPLFANPEQLEIAERLASRQGVLVEGPPGTGKSHTIANLVCHLLATGNRILVTSHTSRALRVLQEKFPPEIAKLCVVLLGNDAGAMQALEDSVQSITERHNHWDPAASKAFIASTENKLDEARRAEARILTDLRILREAETYVHSPRFGCYQGTAQAIASKLKEDENRFSWFVVDPEEDQDPPVSNAEAVELLNLLRDERGSAPDATRGILDPHLLITPAKFDEIVQTERNARSRYETADYHRKHQAYACLANVPHGQRAILADALLDLLNAYEQVSSHIEPWAAEAARQIIADRDRVWRELLKISRTHLDAIKDRFRQVSELQIIGVGDRDRSIVRAQASALLQHLRSGGKLGIGPFMPKVVRESVYLIKEVYVSGRLCNSPEPLWQFLEWLDVVDHLNALATHWSGSAEPPTGTFDAQVAKYFDLCEPLEAALEIHDKLCALREMIATIPGLSEPTWHKTEQLRDLQNVILAVQVEEDLVEARNAFTTLEETVREVAFGPSGHPATRALFDAVNSRETDRYTEAYTLLCKLRDSQLAQQRLESLLRRLQAEAPAVAEALVSTSRDETWDERMGQLNEAWNWRRADRWLGKLCHADAQKSLLADLDSCRNRKLRLIGQLAAALAWAHCFERLNQEQHQYLMAWSMAIKKVGKGTGKYASMHRKAAREYMEKCRSAIPAWIMPIHRVAETIDPKIDTFDVVIVDEASQSGPEALFLQFLAKRIIVVGDDKQISPDNVGLDRQEVEDLRQRYIPDVLFSDALGFDNSFFDQAKIRYRGRIRLREHFRCMPEIIQFSNNLCYSAEPLEPLRQYGTVFVNPKVDQAANLKVDHPDDQSEAGVGVPAVTSWPSVTSLTSVCSSSSL